MYMLINNLQLSHLYFGVLPSVAMWTYHQKQVLTHDNTKLRPTPCLFHNVSLKWTSQIAGQLQHRCKDHVFRNTLRGDKRGVADERTELTEHPNHMKRAAAADMCTTYSTTYYLYSNVNALPSSHLKNFYHLVVEYAGRVHIALQETEKHQWPVKMLVEPGQIFPPEKFRAILSASLGWPTSSYSYADMYTIMTSHSVLCASELVVGLPTSEIWWYKPNQQRRNDLPFAYGWDKMRLHLWKIIGISMAQAEKKEHSNELKSITGVSSLKVVYWSRGSGTRSVVNRNHLVESVSVDFPNFLLVDLSSKAMSLKEQLRIIYLTDILVGPHGAGLTWILAMRPQTALVELTSNLYLRYELFHNLGTVSGSHYYYWVGCNAYDVDKTDPGWGGNMAERHKNHRLTCDPQKVLKAVRKASSDVLHV